MLRRILRANLQLRLFLVGVVMVGAAAGIYETTFNNYLSDTFAIGADTRGFLELPRELPGFLTALFAGLLFFMPETLIAAFSALMVGVGMFGMAFCGHSWSWMMFFLILWSVGTHLMMPVNSSISMDLGEAGKKGRRMGQIQGASIASSFIGCGLVWISMRHLHAGYRFTFIAGGVAAVAGAIALFLMRMPGAHLNRPKFVWRRDYWLYYVLSFLFGARKQIFITFGPWLLVKTFSQPAYLFAELWIAASVLGVVFQPALGRAIDRFGERAVLVFDAICVFTICAGYGFSILIPNRAIALSILCACYVGDQLLFGVGMARSTYLAKIAAKPEHVSPTLSLGVSINHAVSMLIPWAGGFLWIFCGPASVFVAAAGIALLMLVFASMVRTDGKAPV